MASANRNPYELAEHFSGHFHILLQPGEVVAMNANFDRKPFLKGRSDPGSRIAGLYIQPDVARPATYIIDPNGILRETLIAGQSYESFEHRSKPYL